MNELTRPGSRRPQLLPLVGAVLLVLVGGSLTWGFLAAGRAPGMAVLGGLLLGLGVLTALSQLLRTGATTGVRAVVSTGSPAGGALPMVSVQARPRHLLVSCLGDPLGGAVRSSRQRARVRSQTPALGGLLVVLAVLAIGVLVVPARRGLRSSRVELTPEWLAAEQYGARWQVAWADVGGSVPPLAPGRPAAVVLHATARPTRSSGWPGWRKPASAPHGVLPIDVDDLPVSAQVLTRVIALCADDPGLRAQLGTPVSGDWSRWPPGPPGEATDAL